MVNKKAQEMSVTTIILIVLGIFILVVLILGFTRGWGNIKDWIIPSNNVKTIADSCKIACGTDQVYSYCFSLSSCWFRKIRYQMMIQSQSRLINSIHTSFAI